MLGMSTGALEASYTLTSSSDSVLTPVALDYAYDAAGNLLRIAATVDGHLDWATTYGYDALNRVVDTTYRMAQSPYLYAGQPNTVQRPAIQPYASFATGANPMAPIDMASGMQTVANQGLHHQPYYVESIDRVDGSRFYTHQDPGTQVLDAGVACVRVPAGEYRGD